MPPNASDHISNDEVLRGLRVFLRQVEEMLADLQENPRPIVPGRYHESMKAAWLEVQPLFADAVAGLQSAESDLMNKLKAAGLTGSQLVFKLTIFQHAHAELMDHGTPKEGQPRKRPWWKRWFGLFKPAWKRWFGLFKAALKAADVILGSLTSVLPIVEPIKEYKEAVEAGVEVAWPAGE
jgi:hypothetical protein